MLGLTDAEIKQALTDWDSMIDFARRHDQSLDWLARGDVRGMIANRPLAPRA